MNWLAHVFLSEPDLEFRLGNLLADLVKGTERESMSARFLQGVRCHQAIDSFTDRHPVVYRSWSRIGPDYRRFASVLVDVFYDHCLARNWLRFCPQPLTEFTSELYQSIQAQPLELPAEARAAVDRMIEEDRLGSYQTLAGIEAALRRVSERLAARVGKDFALERAVTDLERRCHVFEGDFLEFFPALQLHVEEWCRA